MSLGTRSLLWWSLWVTVKLTLLLLWVSLQSHLDFSVMEPFESREHILLTLGIARSHFLGFSGSTLALFQSFLFSFLCSDKGTNLSPQWLAPEFLAGWFYLWRKNETTSRDGIKQLGSTLASIKQAILMHPGRRLGLRECLSSQEL